MSAPPKATCRLSDMQLLAVRDHIERYAGLKDVEKEDFHNVVARDVWLLENDGYNWTEKGEPPNDGTNSYAWTLNRVTKMLETEGTKDLRKAMNTRELKKWTGEAVFAAECKDAIKAAIYRDHPEADDGDHGFFKHYKTYMSTCYKDLSEDDRAWFEVRAKDWSTWGPSYEVKAENAKNGLAKWLKEVTYKGEHKYGVYMAFVIVPEPGQPGEPRVVDYLRELKYAKEPLSKWVQWDTVTGRLKEYVTKAYNAMKADAKMEPPAEVVPVTEIKGNRKPGPNDPSGIPIEADYVTGRVILPTDIYEERPDAIMWREQALFKEITWMAAKIAANSKEKVSVPWKEIAKDPSKYIAPECLPEEPVRWDFPNNMWVEERKRCLRLWFKLGYYRMLQVKRGKGAAVAATTSQAGAEPGAGDFSGAGGTSGVPPVPILGGNVVNRYGSRGREFLAAAQLELYDDLDDHVTPDVMEDRLIDPAELERTEDDNHTHLAPCVVPHTSEARAQYCLTALQLVQEGQDKITAISCIKSLVGLPSSSRDDTTDKKIANKVSHLVAPNAVSWDAESLLLPDEAAMDVRCWFSTKPYEHNGFLGWSQAWKYMLAMVMFLVSETSRTVNTHELEDSATWDLIRDDVPGASAPVYAVSGRDTLSDEFKTFYLNLDVLLRKAWPGIPPSCRYRQAYSRCGYITRICQAKGMADLAHYVTNMPEIAALPDEPSVPRKFGSWEWGRCGLANEFHTDENLWPALVKTWTSPKALWNDKGLRSVEDGLRLLLKMALAWTDTDKLINAPKESLPVVLQNSVLRPHRMRLDIQRGIAVQTAALKSAFDTFDIAPRPKPVKAFITIAPDLKENMVQAIRRLREKPENLTVFQTRARKEHVRQAGYREQIMNNRNIAKARREEEAATAGGHSSDGPSTANRKEQGKRRVKAAPPLLPVLPLMESLPQRQAQQGLQGEDGEASDEDGDDGTATSRMPSGRAAVSAGARSVSDRGRGTSTRGRGTSTHGRGTSTRGRATSSRGRATSTRGRATASKRKAVDATKPNTTPKSRKRKSKPTAPIDTDSEESGQEEFDLRGFTDEEDDEEEDPEAPEVIALATPRRPPRPRPNYPAGSVADLARQRKRAREEREEDEEAPDTPPTTPYPGMERPPLAGTRMDEPATPMTLSAMSQATGWVTPPSAYEMRPAKKARPDVSVVIRRGTRGGAHVQNNG
ncbi:hypothetical protein PENSPDRAFT_694891 [Peniophora sp. CONT]|nr:hypothetical protein PENSPDRAFT_694891 [Peniophora sp. CONT]